MLRLLLSTVPMKLIGILMLADVALNFANVIGRHFFGLPIFWAEEVMVYISIWGVFIGIIAVTYNGQHLAMDLFSARLSRVPQAGLAIVITVLLAVCCAYTAMQSWTIVKLFVQTGAVSNAAGLPKAIPHAALLIGFSLTALAAVLRIRAQFKSATQISESEAA